VNYDGDLMLYPTPDGGDLNIIGGQPDMDAGLWTTVYLSLFSGVWWGNALSEQAEQLADSIEAVMLDDSNQGRLNVQEAARAALRWLVDDGIAAAVDVEATIPTAGWIALTITITEPAADPTVLRYKINWAGQRTAMGVS
jgi:phage gp46-like protein